MLIVNKYKKFKNNSLTKERILLNNNLTKKAIFRIFLFVAKILNRL
jgi:hypothetical protein